eukprot:scaffold296_cov102-Amphora_coffeaeformis.AAC.17
MKSIIRTLSTMLCGMMFLWPTTLGWLPLQQQIHRHVSSFRRLPTSPISASRLDMSTAQKGPVNWSPIPPEEQEDEEQQGPSLYDESSADDSSGDVHIPAAGISVFDEMDNAQRDRFVSEVVPIPGLTGVAQIVSSPMVRYSFEPLRYLVALSPPTLNEPTDTGKDDELAVAERTFVNSTFVMVDIPPFSPHLAARIRSYMGIGHKLAAILVTSRDAIHYDEAQAVFSNRRSDLRMWKQAFPNTQVIAYRLDTPRDCRAFVTQQLDGYGPFGAADTAGNLTFVETGRPLTYDEWDYNTAQNVLSGTPPPDDDDTAAKQGQLADDEKYTPDAIRAREEDKAILAIYTPGHSFGSVSYVFPKMSVCCSGFTLPVEDNRMDDNEGFTDTGPALDVRGYITTSQAGIKRQMESARSLVKTYYDRFSAILPSRGGPLLLGGSVEERKEDLLQTIDQYQRIGDIYSQLGITSSTNDDE